MSCGCVGPVGLYADGPTACVAHPKVLASIRSEIAASRILSVADARLATRSGLIGIPAVSRSGFNDGLIYPPDEDTGEGASPAMSRARLAPTPAATTVRAARSASVTTCRPHRGRPLAAQRAPRRRRRTPSPGRRHPSGRSLRKRRPRQRRVARPVKGQRTSAATASSSASEATAGQVRRSPGLSSAPQRAGVTAR